MNIINSSPPPPPAPRPFTFGSSQDSSSRQSQSRDVSSSGGAGEIRNIIKPTQHVPWRVDAVSATPERVMMMPTTSTSGTGASSHQENNLVLTSSSYGRWHARAVLGTAASTQLQVWYDDTPRLNLTQQRLQGPYTTLSHPQLNLNNGVASVGGATMNSDNSILLSLQVVPPTSTTTSQNPDETCLLYAANASKGAVVVFKISRHRDLRGSSSAAAGGRAAGHEIIAAGHRHQQPHCTTCCSAQTVLPLNSIMAQQSTTNEENSMMMWADSNGNNEILTSLDVSFSSSSSSSSASSNYNYTPPRITVGTSNGRLFKLHQTPVPLGLQSQQLPSIPSSVTRSSGGGGGFFSSWLGGGGSSSGRGAGDAVFRACWMSSSGGHNSEGFYAITQQGRIFEYTSTSGGASSGSRSSSYTVTTPALVDLMPSLQEYLHGESGSGGNSGVASGTMGGTPGGSQQRRSPTSSSSWLRLKDLQVVATSREVVGTTTTSSLHVLVLTKHETNAVIDESRLYWVRLRTAVATTGSQQKEHHDAHASHAHGQLQIQSATWLNRFVSPQDIIPNPTIVVTSDNYQSAYAAFTCRNHSLPMIFMCLSDQQGAGGGGVIAAATAAPPLLHELDVSVDTVGKFVWSIEPDIVTHGCLVLTSGGCGLRVRHIMAASANMNRTTVPAAGTTSTTNPTTLATLTSHIRSCFWGAYRAGGDPNTASSLSSSLPPSIQNASRDDTEQAVLVFGHELLQHGENPQLEWHSAYINWLSQCGLYRSLSLYARWTLLGQGQQLAVYEALKKELSHPSSPRTDTRRWQKECLASLRAHQVSEWLDTVQSDYVFGPHGGHASPSQEEEMSLWINWLCLALSVGTAYRDDRFGLIYSLDDKSSTALPRVATPQQVPLWTTQPALQHVMKSQLTFWKGQGGAVVDFEAIVTVSTAALQSFADTYYECCSTNPDVSSSIRDEYAQIQRDAIALIRRPPALAATGSTEKRGGGDDAMAFELCRDHNYVAGLCQISYDHERLSDSAQYKLEPMLQEECDAFPREERWDVSTELPFSVFVLKWFCDRGLIGHVLKYGDYCQEALGRIIDSGEPALQPYKWIYDAKQGEYDTATTSLLSTAQDHHSSLGQVKRSLNISSIANGVAVEKENNAPSGMDVDNLGGTKRQIMIDKLRERVNAQEELHGNIDGNNAASSNANKNARLWSPELLLDAALRQCDDAKDQDGKVQACFLGLAVASSALQDNDAREYAATVWSHAIIQDYSTLWEQQQQPQQVTTTSQRTIQETTVFGVLLEQCNEPAVANDPFWKIIKYSDAHVEHLVYQKLLRHSSTSSNAMSVGDSSSMNFVDELRRLLRQCI